MDSNPLEDIMVERCMVEWYGEGLRRSFAMNNSFVLTNKICLNQWCTVKYLIQNTHRIQ